jgi:hypothetical protein
MAVALATPNGAKEKRAVQPPLPAAAAISSAEITAKEVSETHARYCA